MNSVFAQKNGLLYTPEKLDEAWIVRGRIAETAYRSCIGCREDCFEPRIILLRIVALAIMVRVRAGNNICISTAGGGSLRRLVRRFNDDHAASVYVIAASFVASSDWQPTASALPALSIPA